MIAHAVTDNGITWTRVARALEADYDVVMYDRRGHGLSDASESGYAFLWREGKVVHIEGAGHMIHNDRYEPYVEAVRAFLAEMKDREKR